MAMGSCRLFGVEWGVGQLVGPKPNCVSTKKETALRRGGATAISEPYFPTRPSAVLATSPSEGAPLGSCLGAQPKLTMTLFLPPECSRSGLRDSMCKPRGRTPLKKSNCKRIQTQVGVGGLC